MLAFFIVIQQVRITNSLLKGRKKTLRDQGLVVFFNDLAKTGLEK